MPKAVQLFNKVGKSKKKLVIASFSLLIYKVLETGGKLVFVFATGGGRFL